MSMASTTLPNQFFSTKFSAVDLPSPSKCVSFRRQPQRLLVSSSYNATVERPLSTYCIPYRASLYEVLGIEMGATGQEIKTAYRRLARVLHPDVASNNSREDTSTVANDFIEVHKAYVTLSDPKQRADYDRTLFRQRGPCPSVLSSATSYSVGYTSRNWETDQCW